MITRPSIRTDRFTFVADQSLFVTDASDLSDINSSLMAGFDLVSSRSGAVIPMGRPVPQHDREGELTHWVFTGQIAGTTYQAHIHND